MTKKTNNESAEMVREKAKELFTVLGGGDTKYYLWEHDFNKLAKHVLASELRAVIKALNGVTRDEHKYTQIFKT
jgi:hypothetical protein